VFVADDVTSGRPPATPYVFKIEFASMLFLETCISKLFFSAVLIAPGSEIVCCAKAFVPHQKNMTINFFICYVSKYFFAGRRNADHRLLRRITFIVPLSIEVAAQTHKILRNILYQS
jgi:hypothetical protein